MTGGSSTSAPPLLEATGATADGTGDDPRATPDLMTVLREFGKRLECRVREDDGVLPFLNELGDRAVFRSFLLYDAEVAAVDEQVRLLFEELRRRGFLDHAVTIVTADHGEEFLEHGETGHANALYEESVRVPLVITAAGMAAGRVARNVSLVDVAPTVLDLLHLPAERAFEGRSLVAADAPSEALLEFEPIFPDAASRRRHARGIVRGRSKLLVAPDGDATTYDLATDPGEQRGTDVNGVLAEALSAAEARLGARAGGSAPVGRIDDALAQRLRALGYTR